MKKTILIILSLMLSGCHSATTPATTQVNAGGTGKSSLTAWAVICGGTTSTGPLQSLAGVGTSGQVLTSNGAGALPTFQAGGGGAPSGAAGGDLSGTYPNPTVDKLDGATVPSAGALTTGNGLYVTGVSALSYSALNLAGGSNYVTGTLPVNVGGTGAATFTANGVLLGNGTSAFGVTAVGTSGYVLTSNGAGMDPTFQVAGASLTGTTNSGSPFLTALGSSGLNSASGVNNTGIGYHAGHATTSGTDNFYGGYLAGSSNISSNRNTLIGSEAGENITGQENTMLGCQAGIGITSGQKNVVIGALAHLNTNLTASYETAIGHSSLADAAGDLNTAIGFNSGNTLTSGNHNTFLGAETLSSTSSVYGIAIGYGSGCISHTLVAGSVGGEINDIFFGGGTTSTTASSACAAIIHGTGGSGSNNAGASLTIAGGKGTGTSKGGPVLLQTSTSIATGTTTQTLVDRYIVVAQGKTLTDNVATTIATMTLTNGTSGGCKISATIQCTDATDFQSMTQVIEIAIVNKAGTYTSDLVSTSGAKALSAGTLTAVWSITSAGAIQVAADTSLTPSGTNGFVVYYTIENNSQSSITLP